MTANTSAFQQLKVFLKDMFQFEEHDLDFGIYRITRLKRQFIQAFIDGQDENSLQRIVSDALSGVQNSQGDSAKHWLEAFASTLGKKGEAKWKAFAGDPASQDAKKGFEELFVLAEDDNEREQAQAHLKKFTESKQFNNEQLEAKVYNHLLNFFELYYQNGDFGYNTRAATAFKVPYEADYDGSDTLFHWKHKDSYYIKTGNGFHSVRCQIKDEWLEFRLSAGGDDNAETSERNNNKETSNKHYRLVDIQPVKEKDASGKQKQVWQITFALSDSSTSKIDIYTKLWSAIFGQDNLTAYLHKKPGKNDEEPGKPVFNDLSDDFDKAEGGQVKGIGQLRIQFEKYVDELAKRSEFSDLGKNAEARKAVIQDDDVVKALWQIDRNLNKFYVGNDADYFIHKDLQGFLTGEKSRFIKQVIFSDLESLLHAGEDNVTVLIARAFNQVADKLISFLSAIEDFQKTLFEVKKKVVDTDYLISVGKIPEHFYERVFANEEQLTEWKEVFKVELNSMEELEQYPSLVIDTALYSETDPAFQDDLLSQPAFDNLDEQTDGLLINSENWQALNLLQEKLREQIKCIYIDPPYNTGGDGFLYKDSFRHSSWMSMLSDRLDLTRELLSSDGVVFVSVDDNEKNNLADLQKQIFGESYEIIRRTGTPTSQGTLGLSNTYDSLLFSRRSTKTQLMGLPLTPEDRKKYDQQDENGRFLLRSLRMTGEEDRREDRPDMYYAVESPDGESIFPIGPSGYESRWRLQKTEYQSRKDEGRVVWNKVEDKDTKSFVWKPYIKFYEPQQKTVQNIWDKLEGNKKGKRDLKNVIGQVKRLTPKPLELMENVINISSNAGDYVLDFFAGTGSTACACIRLNKTDEALTRKWIACESSDIFDLSKERVKRVLYSLDWKNQKPKDKGSTGTQAIVKIQTFEQYEDLLDNLQPVWDENQLPNQVPVRYLFRPEQNKLISTIDLSRPFEQKMRVGKDREEKSIDLMETWCVVVY